MNESIILKILNMNDAILKIMFNPVIHNPSNSNKDLYYIQNKKTKDIRLFYALPGETVIYDPKTERIVRKSEGFIYEYKVPTYVPIADEVLNKIKDE